jgi:vacuolar-type H+-ATPase subunit F/Vma7
MKIAFVGGKTSSMGFHALGVDTFQVPVPEEAPEVWERVDPDEYTIIFVTEPVYTALSEQIAELREVREGRLPVVTVLPAVSGSRGAGFEEVRSLVEKAVGADIMG